MQADNCQPIVTRQCYSLLIELRVRMLSLSSTAVVANLSLLVKACYVTIPVL